MGRVLVVDDDTALREAVAEAIADAGYEVEQAENGRDALDKMRRDADARPCIVLLDLMMPVMDGWQVVTEMHTDPALATVPVWIVSAQDRLPPPHSAGVLRKPVTVESLLSAVAAHCGPRDPA